MTEFERLLDGSADDAVSARERELLAALGPSRAHKDAVWQKVTGSLLTAGAVTAVATKGAASTSAASLWLKSLLVLGLSLPLAGGGYYFWSRGEASAPARVASPPAAPAASIAPLPPTPSEPLALPPSASPPSSSEPATRRAASEPEARPAVEAEAPTEHALEEENRLLREARAAFRAGDSAGARTQLAALAKKFPRGALVQEREFLGVQIALGAGEPGAQGQARRFIEKYPKSPYAPRVEALLAAP